MDIFINTADDKYFLVVFDRLGTEEFLWLLERAFVAFDFIRLRVKGEAVGDPTIVTSKNEDFFVIEREAAHCVACTPVIFTIRILDLIPLVLEKVSGTIEPLNRFERLLVLGVSAANYIDKAIFKDTNRMVVA